MSRRFDFRSIFILCKSDLRYYFFKTSVRLKSYAGSAIIIRAVVFVEFVVIGLKPNRTNKTNNQQTKSKCILTTNKIRSNEI